MKQINSLTKIVAGGLLIAATTSLTKSESIPLGSLNVIEDTLVVDQNATLDWEITYPPVVEDDITKTDVNMKVRFITCAIGPVNTLEVGYSIDGIYQRFYAGYSEDHPSYELTPGTLVVEDIVSKGRKIEFLAKHNRTKLDPNWVSTGESSQEFLILELRKGDAVPTVAGAGDQRSVSEILVPYSEDGIVNIGDDEVIYLFELYIADTNHFGFDLQDLVLLVSYEQVALSK